MKKTIVSTVMFFLFMGPAFAQGPSGLLEPNEKQLLMAALIENPKLFLEKVDTLTGEEKEFYRRHTQALLEALEEQKANYAQKIETDYINAQERAKEKERILRLERERVEKQRMQIQEKEGQDPEVREQMLMKLEQQEQKIQDLENRLDNLKTREQEQYNYSTARVDEQIQRWDEMINDYNAILDELGR